MSLFPVFVYDQVAEAGIPSTPKGNCRPLQTDMGILLENGADGFVFGGVDLIRGSRCKRLPNKLIQGANENLALFTVLLT